MQRAGKAPCWVSHPRSQGSKQSPRQPKRFGGRVSTTTAEPRARRPAQSCLCGGQKKRGFIAANIGPLCTAFLTLCRGTASVYMAALDGAGTLHSSERPFCKCQRATLSGHCRLHGPVSPARDALCCWESHRSPARGCAVSSGCPPSTNHQDLDAWGGRKQWEEHDGPRQQGWMGSSTVRRPQRARLDGALYSTMALESKVGWGPLCYDGPREQGWMGSSTVWHKEEQQKA